MDSKHGFCSKWFGSGSTSWFERKKYKSSLGWSSKKLSDTAINYTKDSYFSSYNYYSIPEYSCDNCLDRLSFEEKKKIVSLTSRAYKAVKDMVVILDFPYQVNIRFGYFSFCTINKPHRNILVPSLVLDDSSKSDGDKINILCGLGIHEACHLKYTDRKILSYKLPSIKDNKEKAILSLIENVLEDIRVEDRLLIERPGYAEFISEAKEYVYSLLENKFDKVSFSSRSEKLIYNTILLIRYPDKITDFGFLETNKGVFEKVKDIVSTPPGNTKETVVKSIEILKALNIDIDDISDSIVEYLMSSFINSSDTTEDCISPHSAKYISKIFHDDRMESLISGDVEFGENADVYFKKEEGNKDVYKKLVDTISTYIPGIRKALKGYDKNYDFNIYGCRNGLLDTTKLAEAYQGVQQVYVRQGHVRTNKTTLCVLVDESGSMGYNTDPSDCAYVARLAVVLINEALKNLNGVDLYIYGHTADERNVGEVELFVYKEGDSYINDTSLTRINGREQNRDGSAIYEAAKRVRKFTDSHVIMLVLSDGEPCAFSGYEGTYAIRDVRENVTRVEKMDFDVIQVSIQKIDRAKEMFSNVICLYQNLSNLPKELSSLVKKLVIDNKKTVIS